MNRWDRLKWKAIGVIGKTAIDLLFSTIRIEQDGLDRVRYILESKRYIAAIWHSRILLVSYFFQGLNGVAMTSQSEDGEFVAQIVGRQGQETVRGSTTRGGLRALAAMVKRLKERSRPATIIPDGPQGPRFKVQPGIITLAKKTGYPLIPMTYSGRKIKILSTWDRFILPYPFTTCRLVYGNPISIPKFATRKDEERFRHRLEQELIRITTQADRHFNHEIS